MDCTRPLTALVEAQAALIGMLALVAPREVSCGAAVGLIAAKLAPLAQPVPMRAIALRAGLAACSQELAGASSFSPAFLPTAPTRVAIGEALPDGCDSVLDEAALDLSGPAPQAFAESYPGENTRRAGEDFRANAIIVPEGCRIGARHALAAVRAGLKDLPVRQARVTISGRGEIADFIAHLLREDGAELARGPDADLCVVIGAADEPVSWTVQGVALEPGRDCAIGRAGGVPAVHLPSSPDQAFAGYVALLRPAVDRLAGRAPRASRTLQLTNKISSRVGMAELALLKEQDGRYVPLAVGDLPLQTFGAATHVTLIAAGSEGFAAGELCAADPLDT